MNVYALSDYHQIDKTEVEELRLLSHHWLPRHIFHFYKSELFMRTLSLHLGLSNQTYHANDEFIKYISNEWIPSLQELMDQLMTFGLCCFRYLSYDSQLQCPYSRYRIHVLPIETVQIYYKYDSLSDTLDYKVFDAQYRGPLSSVQSVPLDKVRVFFMNKQLLVDRVLHSHLKNVRTELIALMQSEANYQAAVQRMSFPESALVTRQANSLAHATAEAAFQMESSENLTGMNGARQERILIDRRERSMGAHFGFDLAHRFHEQQRDRYGDRSLKHLLTQSNPLLSKFKGFEEKAVPMFVERPPLILDTNQEIQPYPLPQVYSDLVNKTKQMLDCITAAFFLNTNFIMGEFRKNDSAHEYSATLENIERFIEPYRTYITQLMRIIYLDLFEIYDQSALSSYVSNSAKKRSKELKHLQALVMTQPGAAQSLLSYSIQFQFADPMRVNSEDLHSMWEKNLITAERYVDQMYAFYKLDLIPSEKTKLIRQLEDQRSLERKIQLEALRPAGQGDRPAKKLKTATAKTSKPTSPSKG
jgi:hypothetical protein